jgi:uncharacterized protein YbjT (DUF2867 family)
MSTVLVTGASGRLGRQLLPRLLAAGHEVTATSRRPQPRYDGVRWEVADLRSGSGTVTHADVIVHCATAPHGDEEMTARVIAAKPAHVVYPSIVGIDKVPLGYYRTKLAVEQSLARSGIPYTVVRATQFHDLLLHLFTVQRRLPALLVPSATSFQPVDAGEVADRLVQCVAAGPSNRMAEFGGPEVVSARDLGRTYLGGSRRPVLPVPVPGKVGRAYRAGGHLMPSRTGGTITFAQFLAGREPR